MRLTLSLLVILLLLTSSITRAQGTRADYDRAQQMPRLTRGKLLNASISPNWSKDGNSFWFEESTIDGPRKIIQINALDGTRTALPPGTKPPARRGIPPLPQIIPSTEGSDQVDLTINNQSSNPIQMVWIDTAGHRHPYGDAPPGEQREQNTYANHVWLITKPDGTPIAAYQTPTGGGEIIVRDDTTFSPPPPPDPDAEPENPGPDAHSPDGRYEIRIEHANVILREINTDQSWPLTTDGTRDDAYGHDIFWSPDSHSAIVLKTQEGDHRRVYYIRSSPKDQLQPRLESYDYLKPGDRVPIVQPHLFDIASHREIPVKTDLFPNPWETSDFRWDPDSSRFTFLYNQRGHQALRLIAIDAKRGATTPIIDETSKTFIDYSGKFFLNNPLGSDEIIWMSERDGWNHLYLYDAHTGKVKNQITRGPWVVRDVDRVDRKNHQIWFQAGGIDPKQDPYYIHFCRINFDGTGLLDLTPGDGTHKITYSPDQRFYLDTYSRVDLPPVTELRRTADAKLICPVEHADTTLLEQQHWLPPIHFVAKGRDGVTDIYGIIYRPTTFDPSEHYPVLEDIYAGPQGSFVPKSFIRWNEDMSRAELGFAIVQIDGMGTSNRSKAFHDVCWRNLGDAGFPDRILWLKAAAAKYPWLDISRVGIFGTSAGGQDALRAVEAFGDFYKAAVADCGCHDNRMDKIWWNEQWMGYPIGPWYAEQSNVTNAQNLAGALLLIVAEDDHNVDPASTLQVVNALIKANKDFDLLVIPNADHGEDGPYGERRRRDFFVRHLLHVEPRQN
jgi:dipeptidyl aminopeptidase/acylaminoacyl peptidase